jgi:hypothetical protein
MKRRQESEPAGQEEPRQSPSCSCPTVVRTARPEPPRTYAPPRPVADSRSGSHPPAADRSGHTTAAAASIAKKSLGQRHADQLLVVAGKHAAIGERGMAPDDSAAEALVGRLEEPHPAEFLVLF